MGTMHKLLLDKCAQKRLAPPRVPPNNLSWSRVRWWRLTKMNGVGKETMQKREFLSVPVATTLPCLSIVVPAACQASSVSCNEDAECTFWCPLGV